MQLQGRFNFKRTLHIWLNCLLHAYGLCVGLTYAVTSRVDLIISSPDKPEVAHFILLALIPSEVPGLGLTIHNKLVLWPRNAAIFVNVAVKDTEERLRFVWRPDLQGDIAFFTWGTFSLPSTSITFSGIPGAGFPIVAGRMGQSLQLPQSRIVSVCPYPSWIFRFEICFHCLNTSELRASPAAKQCSSD